MPRKDKFKKPTGLTSDLLTGALVDIGAGFDEGLSKRARLTVGKLFTSAPQHVDDDGVVEVVVSKAFLRSVGNGSTATQIFEEIAAKHPQLQPTLHEPTYPLGMTKELNRRRRSKGEHTATVISFPMTTALRNAVLCSMGDQRRAWKLTRRLWKSLVKKKISTVRIIGHVTAHKRANSNTYADSKNDLRAILKGLDYSDRAIDTLVNDNEVRTDRHGIPWTPMAMVERSAKELIFKGDTDVDMEAADPTILSELVPSPDLERLYLHGNRERLAKELGIDVKHLKSATNRIIFGGELGVWMVRSIKTKQYRSKGELTYLQAKSVVKALQPIADEYKRNVAQAKKQGRDLLGEVRMERAHRMTKLARAVQDAGHNVFTLEFDGLKTDMPVKEAMGLVLGFPIKARVVGV